MFQWKSNHFQIGNLSKKETETYISYDLIADILRVIVFFLLFILGH